MAKQRQIRRHPASILRVTFEHATTSGRRVEATAWDASLGGMFLETSTPLEEGALISLEITTPDAKVAADARVLWARAASDGEDQPAGMAVRFIDLPDDVSVALNRALQRGMAEKTILGVGGATQKPTQPGIVPGAGAPGRVPRETQIGIAPPANPPVKRHLVISETSLPETPAATRVEPSTEPRARADIDAPKEPVRSRARSSPSSEPPLPPGAGGGLFGRLLLLLALGGAAGAVYVYRDKLAEMLAGPAPAPTEAPSATPIESASAPTQGDDASREAIEATPDAEPVAAEFFPTDAALDVMVDASDVHDAGHADAGRSDAGARDAGPRDAGRDSGTHGGAKPDAGRSPKHP